MLLSIIRAFSAYRNYRRQMQAMSELSDRELDDIGLLRQRLPHAHADSVRMALLFAGA
jgi:uncharacterized protein YjiS (DUF1127 family)